jgi:hypothetical protein
MTSRFSRAPLRLARLGRPFLLLLFLPLLAAGSPPPEDSPPPPGLRLPGWTWGPGFQFPGWTLPLPNELITAPHAPPALPQETIPPPPAGPAGYFEWDPGHWHWTGQTYTWIRGAYVERPYRGSTWVPGDWNDHDHDNVWIYTPGHWR